MSDFEYRCDQKCKEHEKPKNKTQNASEPLSISAAASSERAESKGKEKIAALARGGVSTYKSAAFVLLLRSIL